MKFNTDSIFVIGSSHKVNQDYALSNEHWKDGFHEPPFVLISDGCSKSKNSDFGSRMLARAALYAMQPTDCYFVRDAIKKANDYRAAMGLNFDCLAATLLMTKISEDNFKVVVAGDGYVVAKRTSGELTIVEYKFDKSAPYYLKYELSPTEKEEYFRTFGNKLKMTITTLGSAIIKTESEVEINPTVPFFVHEFPIEITDFVALMSDGAGSFQTINKTDTSITTVPNLPEVIIPQLLNFKSVNGFFVQRKVKCVLDELAKTNCRHTDDLSIGVLTKCE